MNHAVKVEAILAELKANDFGPIPTENFAALCDYVTKWMLKKYNLREPSSINWGYCFIWAYLVWALWPKDEITFKTVSGHVVVKRGNYYFDSEHTHGDSRLNQFCSFKYKADKAKHVDVITMAWFWCRCGKQLREFRRLVRKVSPSIYPLVRDNGNTHWNNSIENFISWEWVGTLREVKA